MPQYHRSSAPRLANRPCQREGVYCDGEDRYLHAGCPLREETKSYHSVCGAEAPDSSSDDCVGWKRLSLRGAGRATRQSRRDCFASLTMTAPKDVANY